MYQEDIEVRPFNLYMAGSLVHEVTPIFKTMDRQCAQKFELRLSQILQTNVEVTSSLEVSQKTLKVAHNEDTFSSWVSVNDYNGRDCTISTDRSLITGFLNTLCGGAGKADTYINKSEPSSGERRVLMQTSKTLFECYEEVYRPIMPLRLATTSEVQDAASQKTQHQGKEYVFISTYHTKIGEMSGCITISASISAIAASGLGRNTDNVELETKLKHAITSVSIPLTAIIGQQQTSLRKITALRAGDILPLGKPMDAEVYIGEKHICQARVLSDDNRLMLKVVSSDEQDNPDHSDNPEPRRSSRRARSGRSRVNSTPKDADTETSMRTRSQSREDRAFRRRNSTRGEP